MYAPSSSGVPDSDLDPGSSLSISPTARADFLEFDFQEAISRLHQLDLTDSVSDCSMPIADVEDLNAQVSALFNATPTQPTIIDPLPSAPSLPSTSTNLSDIDSGSLYLPGRRRIPTDSVVNEVPISEQPTSPLKDKISASIASTLSDSPQEDQLENKAELLSPTISRSSSAKSISYPAIPDIQFRAFAVKESEPLSPSSESAPSSTSSDNCPVADITIPTPPVVKPSTPAASPVSLSPSATTIYDSAPLPNPSARPPSSVAFTPTPVKVPPIVSVKEAVSRFERAKAETAHLLYPPIPKFGEKSSERLPPFFVPNFQDSPSASIITTATTESATTSKASAPPASAVPVSPSASCTSFESCNSTEEVLSTLCIMAEQNKPRVDDLARGSLTFRPYNSTMVWSVWKSHAMDALDAKNMLEYVTGIHVAPVLPADIQEGTAEWLAWRQRPEVRTWFTKNAEIRAAMKNVFSTADVRQFGQRSARDIWIMMEAKEQIREEAMKHELRHHWNSLKWDDKTPIREFLLRTQDMLAALNDTGYSLSVSDYKEKIWTALPDYLSSLKSHLRLTSTTILPNFADIDALVLREVDLAQVARKAKAAAAEAKAKAARVNETKPGKDNGISANTTNSQASTKQRRETRICNYCKKPGHIIADCRALKAKKERESAGGSSPAPPSSQSKSSVDTDINIPPFSRKGGSSNTARVASFAAWNPRSWILDTGASHHMCNDQHLICDYIAFDSPIEITTAGPVPIFAKGSGAVTLNLPSGFTLVLQNVWYVPDAGSNMLSVKCYAKDHVEQGKRISFGANDAFFLPEGEVIEAAETDLFLIFPISSTEPSNNEPNAATATTIGTENDLQLYHRRLGHVNFHKLRAMWKVCPGIPKFPPSIPDPSCIVCAESKMKRQLHSAELDDPKEVNDIVYFDICGPLRELGPQQERYMLLFIDRKSRFITTYCINHRDDVYLIIPDFFATSKVLSGQNVKMLVTDNAKEFSSQSFANILRYHGATLRLVPRYAPFLNGLAERGNQSIIGISRSMLIGGKIALKWWPFAIKQATYVYNRITHTALNGATPIYLYTNKQPSLSSLITFGAKVITLVPEDVRKQPKANLDPKLAGRGQQGIFLGNRDIEGYVIFNITNGMVELTADLKVINKLTETGADYSYTPTDTDLDLLFSIESSEGPSFQGPRVTKATALMNGSEIIEPKNALDALTGPLHEEWKAAMMSELNSMYKSNTFVIWEGETPKNVVTSKWVFKIKRSSTGEILKYKARLVARGFAQRFGIDYFETSAPVIYKTSLRLLFCLAAISNWKIYQYDVETAYLHGTLPEGERVFMAPPKNSGFPVDCVLKLEKGLYGLKQGGRVWFLTLAKKLKQNGWRQLMAEVGIYVKGESILAIYVDDIVNLVRSSAIARDTLAELKTAFPVKDMGEIKDLLGVQVHVSNTGITINQKAYIDQLLMRHGIPQQQPNRPLPANLKDYYLTEEETKATKLNEIELKDYQQLVGEILFLSQWTRLDIAFAASTLGRFNNCATPKHMRLAEQVFGYVARTSESFLHYKPAEQVIFSVYTDSDFAGHPKTRQSTAGYVFLINGQPIDWRSSLQSRLSGSSAEAEFMALHDVIDQIRWMRIFLSELGQKQTEPTPIYVDSSSAKSIANAIGLTRNVRHLTLEHAIVHERIDAKEVELIYIPTNDQLSDIFTKSLPAPRHCDLARRIGVNLVFNF